MRVATVPLRRGAPPPTLRRHRLTPSPASGGGLGWGYAGRSALSYYSGGVVDHELHRSAAAVVVAAEVAGDVDRPAARSGKKRAERPVGGAEGDRVEPARADRV